MDEALKTYLIEVNTNPCLEESNQLLKSLLPRMLDDMFNLVLDPLFNHLHLYKDQLKATNQAAQDNRPDGLNSGGPGGQHSNQDKFNPIFPNFEYKPQKSLKKSIYSLPGSLFEKGHEGYRDEDNLW